MVCELLGGKYQEMALFFYITYKKFNMDGGIFGSLMIEEHLGKVLVSLSHFMPATLEEVKIGRIHDFILSCRGLYVSII